ncbi:MAG: nodulation protein NfeD [Anaerolineae bacterium]|jgi:membrane-bound serine protease (ClpP class)|nr:nodulation protein NfeD [Anaerolineae bacterium]MBL8104678.1 nodulation protein NfeD [Anaerolineales bacterium]MCC7188401.1 nodulation protein NfeD [Anaerolineales bacterium]
MKRIGLLLIFLGAVMSVFQPARAQSDEPLALVMTADGPIMPPMYEYIKRGVETAERRNAEVLIIQLNTPGGLISTMKSIVAIIRASDVPVIVYVSPRGAWAGSAGALVTMSGHASAMAPETVIGFASPVGGSGEDLGETMKAKEMEALTSLARTLTERRGAEAVKLAEAMIVEAKAVTNQEALEAGFIDFVVDDIDDLLESLNGFTVQMSDGPRVLNTENADVQPLDMSFIERFILLLIDPNIAFLLIAIGVQAVLIEISSPGGWVAGFIGVVCLTLATYGVGVLPVNWFGFIFMATAFVLFILDIKAPTHGALTAAGVASFIVGALVLFNSPGTPQFQRVSVPLVIATGILLGLFFFGILVYALRALRVPVSVGVESLAGKIGTVRSWDEAGGQVQLESELWSASSVNESEKISKGDKVEVVEVSGIRLKVRKK